jgi:sec-independent protein translocase protein TatA
MLSGIGTPEILLILVVLVLLFGAKRLPDTARSLGKSMRIFKSETRAMRDDDDEVPPAPPAAPRSIEAPPTHVTESRPVSETERTDR